MCCHGCQAVATLISQSGLSRYYDFRDALPQRPDEQRALEDYTAWSRPAVLEHHARLHAPDQAEATLVLENVHCAACAWLIQRGVGELPGVEEVRTDIHDGRTQIRFDPTASGLGDIAQRLDALGYRPHLDSPEAADERDRAERSQLLKAIIVAGLGMMQVGSYALAGYIGAFQDMDAVSARFLQLISMIVAVPVVLYSGRIFYLSAWRTLKRRHMGMDVPVAAAMLIALGASILITFLNAGEDWFDSVVMFIFLLLLGRYAVLITRQRAGSARSAMVRALPAAARRIEADGRLSRVALVELLAGDRVQVAAGEPVPADGIVRTGQALIDESLLSGESMPRRRSAGDSVLAGSMVQDGTLEVEITEIGQGTVLAGIVRLLERARHDKPRLARAADRLAGRFVAFVLTGALLTTLFWWQQDPSRLLPIVIAVLVVSCPCALALGTPVALASATRGFARLGVLVAGSEALEQLPRINHVVLDKTGTLTQTRMQVVDLQQPPGAPDSASESLGPAELMRIAGRLERISTHPLASAFRDHDDGAPVEEAEAVMSAGVAGQTEGRHWRLGRPDWALNCAADAAPPAPGPGQWLVLADEERLAAWLRLDSPLRAGTQALIDDLQARGIRITLASGDAQASVEHTARQLGLEDYRGDLRPDDKLELLRRLQAEGACVAMVGDGINDAPVLAGADLSIALAEGADIARTQADLILLGNSLAPIPQALDLGHKVLQVIRQNLAWALFYNLIALPAAAAGLVAPWLAAIGMSISSLLVVANGRRAGRLPGSTAGQEGEEPASPALDAHTG